MDHLKGQREMTDTLLREFEEWLRKEYKEHYEHDYVAAIIAAQTKLDDLKKLHKIESIRE
jgi:hypothetical protein